METPKKKGKPNFNSLLPKEVAKLYRIRLDYPKLIHRFSIGKFGVIDLKTMSVEKAERLVNLGADFIAPKNVRSKPNS
jgi:hypothetical protein